MRIDWYGNVRYPHELILEKLRLLHGALRNLEESSPSAALRKLYQVDNNAYAFMFDAQVYHHFTDSVLRQPPRRQKWCAGRLIGHENLYDTVICLLDKQQPGADFTPEQASLRAAILRQEQLLKHILTDMDASLRRSYTLALPPQPAKE